MHKFTKETGINLVIENPSWKIDYLNLNFNLLDHTFYPYRKDNNKINYINSKSNHPPSTIKNISENVNNRLSRNAANEQIFENSIHPYKQALISSGHEGNLKFDPNVKVQQNQVQSKRKKRGRKITWFNPPFSLNVKSNIGKIFLQILDECFDTLQ